MPQQGNIPQKTETKLVVNRNQAENRAAWLALIYDEMLAAGIDPEPILRRAIGRHGVMRAEAKRALYRAGLKNGEAMSQGFASKLGQDTFEMDNIRYSEDRLDVDFHYCPLQAAWTKMGLPDRVCAILCDIAMEGDREFARALGWELTLDGTIAEGAPCCKLCFHK